MSKAARSEPVVLESYTDFNPHEYLNEYYLELSEENDFLIRFYHQTYATLADGLIILELGGGPTLYQTISASRRAREIIFTDFLPANRRQVELWLQRAPDAFDWSAYFQRVATLESPACPSGPALEERVRRCIQRVLPCNLYRENPLAPHTLKNFDLVSSAFCLEAVTRNQSDFRVFLRRVRALLKPGGLLVATMVRESSAYKVGRRFFPACPLDEAQLAEALTVSGFGITGIETLATGCDHGYTGIMAVVAWRPAKE